MPDTDTPIGKSLLRRIERKKESLDARRPLSKDVVQKLREEMRLTHTYHSNAIEGNTLTLRETKLVIEEGLTVGGKPLAEHLEATGNAHAFDRIEDLSRDRKAIDHIIVQEIHEIATKGLLADSGLYRTKNVRIAGRKRSPPDFSKVPTLMDEFLKSLAKMRRNPIETVAYMHHRFVEIHPFTDGNGRVARLLTNLYLMKQGYPPVVLRKEDRRKYYEYLEKGDRGDLGALTSFIGKAVDESLTLYLSIFGGKDELVPLAYLAKTSPYSQEYLSLRARQGVLDAIRIGNVWHSSRRALEEYAEEHGR